MVADPGSESGTGVCTWPFLAWAVLVLLGYVAARDEDLQPVLLALGERVLDLGAPLLVTLLHLPTGSLLARRLGFELRDATGRLLIIIAIALTSASFTAVICALIGVLQASALLLLPAVMCIYAVREWGPLLTIFRECLRELRESVLCFPGLLAAGILAGGLLMTLTPSVSQDALHYHLAVPAHWIAAGGFDDLPGNVYARFPMHVEMLFATALAVRGEIAAKVFHWMFAVLTCLVLRQLAGRLGSRRAASWAPVLFLSIPTVFRVATWAYVEMGLIFYLLLAWDTWLGERGAWRPRYWRTGLWLGVACGIKYTAVPIALAVSLFLIIRERRRHPLRATGQLFASGVIGGGFWYVRNLVETGNPVFPFLYSWFGGSGWDGERARVFQHSLAEWGELSWALPFDLTFDAIFSSVPRFDGVIGPVFLIGAPLVALAAVRRPMTRSTVGLVVLLLVSWVTTTRQIRFLLPALAVLATLIPIGWECLPVRRPRRVASRLAGIGVLLALTSHLLIFSHEAPIAHAVGLESSEQNRARRLPGGDYELFRRLPDVVPDTGRVLFAASGNPVFLCERAHHADSVVENHTLRSLLGEGSDPASVARAFADRGFTHLLFRFDLVFGEAGVKSDLTPVEQELLGAVLNAQGRLRLSSGETLLYEIEPPEAVP